MIQKLDGSRSYCPGSAIYQGILPGFDFRGPDVAEGVMCTFADRCGFQKRQAIGHMHDGFVFVYGQKFGMSAKGFVIIAKNLVAHLKIGYIFSHFLDNPREFGTQCLLFGSKQAAPKAGDKIHGASETGVRPVYGRGMNLNQNFILLRHRLGNILQFGHFGWAIFRVNDCFHKFCFLLHVSCPFFGSHGCPDNSSFLNFTMRMIRSRGKGLPRGNWTEPFPCL